MKYFKYFFNYIFSFLYDVYYFLFGNLKSRIQNFSYYRKSKLYPDYLKQGNMAEAVRFLAQKYCRGKGIDIGAGKWPLKGARPIENNQEENAYKINEKNESLDFIFSSHVLEHLSDWQKTLKEWHRVLKLGGFLFLYLPHPSSEMWQTKINRFHQWNLDIQILENFLTNNLKMEIKEKTYLPDGYLSFVIIAKKL